MPEFKRTHAPYFEQLTPVPSYVKGHCSSMLTSDDCLRRSVMNLRDSHMATDPVNGFRFLGPLRDGTVLWTHPDLNATEAEARSAYPERDKDTGWNSLVSDADIAARWAARGWPLPTSHGPVKPV